MIDAVLFDWDGTLIDSRDALIGAWHLATEEVLGRRWPAGPEDERLVLSLPGSRLFPKVAGDAEHSARLTAAFQKAYETTGERVRAFPGVVEALGGLRDAGLAIAVVTSKARRRFDADAARVGVRELVEVAVCQEDTTAHKPDPAPIVLAFRTLGVVARRAVMVGDTPVDVAAGTAAGIPVVGVAWGAAGPVALLEAGAKAVARDADELVHLVLELGGRSQALVS